MDEKKCLGRCGEVKPLTDFTPSTQNRDGRIARCKVCTAADQRDRHAIATIPPKKITADDRNFYLLGTHKADDRIRELELALAAMKTANKALLEIIQDADRRDARRPLIPA